MSDTLLYLSGHLELGQICAVPCGLSIRPLLAAEGKRMLDKPFKTLITDKKEAALVASAVGRPIAAGTPESCARALFYGDTLILVDVTTWGLGVQDAHIPPEAFSWYLVTVKGD